MTGSPAGPVEAAAEPLFQDLQARALSNQKTAKYVKNLSFKSAKDSGVSTMETRKRPIATSTNFHENEETESYMKISEGQQQLIRCQRQQILQLQDDLAAKDDEHRENRRVLEKKSCEQLQARGDELKAANDEIERLKNDNATQKIKIMSLERDACANADKNARQKQQLAAELGQKEQEIIKLKVALLETESDFNTYKRNAEMK